MVDTVALGLATLPACCKSPDLETFTAMDARARRHGVYENREVMAP